MKPDPKQLALMISLIGLGLSATQPARAESPLFVYAEPVLPPEAELDALPDPARPMAAWLAEIPAVQALPEVPQAQVAAEAPAVQEDRLGQFIEQVVLSERVPSERVPSERELARTEAPPKHAAAVVPPQAVPAPKRLAPVAAPEGADTAAQEPPRIVVATSTDTVLRGLESLIAGTGIDDDAGRNDTLVVDTQSEKVLATLAQVLPPPQAHPFGPMADAERLDGVRGGFTTPAGLQFSFGIERAVYVNGDLVATTTLNLSNLQQDIEQRVADAVGGVVVMPAPTPGPAPTPAPAAPVVAPPSATPAPTPAPVTAPPVPSSSPVSPSPAPMASAPTVPAPQPAPAPAPTMLVNTGGPLGVVQIGPGNSLPAGGLGGATVGTVIQNTLNDQMIQNVMTINATVNSLQVLKSFDIQSAVRSAIHDALRR